jgi:hypothetical protein
MAVMNGTSFAFGRHWGKVTHGDQRKDISVSPAGEEHATRTAPHSIAYSVICLVESRRAG